MTEELPAAVDAERQVLGAMLLDVSACARAQELLRAGDLFVRSHADLFELVTGMALAGKPIDPVSVAMEARKAGIDPMFVRDLAEEVTTVGALEHHAGVVRGAATRRQLLSAASRITELAKDPRVDEAELMGESERLVMDAATHEVRGTGVTWQKAHHEAVERLEYMSQVDTPVTGLPTGFQVLDDRFSGLQPGQVYLVAARPAVGKTAFVTQLAVNVAKRGTPVAFFSLEMSAVEIASRAACSEADVSVGRIRRNALQAHEWTRFVEAQELIADLPITVYDDSAGTPIDVTARVRRNRPGVVIVDYIQLMRWHRPMDSRQQEVSEVSRALKLMARQLDVPVLACAQLNRQSEARADKRPILSDLRESGSLEQDADVVMFLHREDKWPQRIEIITQKHRHGSTGTDMLTWRPDVTRFESYMVVGPGSQSQQLESVAAEG